MSYPSPAAAAGVSRVLAGAGIPKAREISKGCETEGYATELRPDCVEVQWVAGLLVPDDEDRLLIVTGLTRCAAALAGKYMVDRVVRDVAYPGRWLPRQVLEVRSGRWGR